MSAVRCGVYVGDVDDITSEIVKVWIQCTDDECGGMETRGLLRRKKLGGRGVYLWRVP